MQNLLIVPLGLVFSLPTIVFLPLLILAVISVSVNLAATLIAVILGTFAFFVHLNIKESGGVV